MLFVGVVTNAVKLRCLLHYTLYQKIPMSSSRIFMSPYFLTTSAIPSFDDFSPNSFMESLFFFSIKFLQQRQKLSKDAAAVMTALSKLLRSQRQSVATLRLKKLAWERKFFWNRWKLSKKYVSFVYLKLFGVIYLHMTEVQKEKNSNLPPKHFPLCLSSMVTSVYKPQPMKINIFFGRFPVRPASA